MGKLKKWCLTLKSSRLRMTNSKTKYQNLTVRLFPTNVKKLLAGWTKIKLLKLMNTSIGKRKLKAFVILLLASSINKGRHLKMECQVVKIILDHLWKKWIKKKYFFYCDL